MKRLIDVDPIQANIRLRLLVCDGRGVEDVWRVAQLVEPCDMITEGHGFESRLAVRLIFYYVVSATPSCRWIDQSTNKMIDCEMVVEIDANRLIKGIVQMNVMVIV